MFDELRYWAPGDSPQIVGVNFGSCADIPSNSYNIIECLECMLLVATDMLFGVGAVKEKLRKACVLD